MSVTGVYVIQRVLSVAQAVPFVGVFPAVVKGALSVAEVVAGLALVVIGISFASIGISLANRTIKEGSEHLFQGLQCFCYAALNTVTVGFAGLVVETFCIGCKKC